MYEIVWTQQAQKDYMVTLMYWNEHTQSTVFSLRLIGVVKQTEKLLSNYPKLGLIIDGKRKLHKINMEKHFSLVYKLKKKQVVILAFWDNRRNPNDLKI